jgi:16S rRNA U1498 N3-methylase RsmE
LALDGAMFPPYPSVLRTETAKLATLVRPLSSDYF